MKFICKPPGKKSIAVLKRDAAIISPSITREYSIVLKRAQGCYVWDLDGHRYLDFAGGVAVANVGHTNPEVMAAVRKQTRIATHVGFADFCAELPVRFAETLVDLLPPHLNRVFISNSGTEAVEAAYKLARWHSKKKYTIAFKGAFHGRTMGSLSMTNSKHVQRDRYGPFLPVRHTLFPNPYRMRMEPEEAADYCLTLLEKQMKKHEGNIAAVFLETVQGEGGYIVPPKSFIQGVRELCTSYDALLCDDEVQSGCFRTGKFMAIEHFGVKPDIVAMSKAIGGGMPIGATVANKSVMDWIPGSHANTFGGNLAACAAGIAAMNYMKKKRLGERATVLGKFALKRLNEMKDRYEIIGDVRGLGLMIGIEIVKDKGSRAFNPEDRHKILCAALTSKLLLISAGRSVIRMCPPLTITQEQLSTGLDLFEDAVKTIAK